MTGTSERKESPLLKQRKAMEELEQVTYANLPPLSPSLEEFWVNIPLSDNWLSRTLVVRPKPTTVESFATSPRISTSRTCKKRPVIVHFHGGGYTTGSPIQLAHPARLFALQFDATVLCPSYRLAPEHPWPQSMKDGMELVQFISSNKSYHYGADPAVGFILGGVSTGASIATVVAGLTSEHSIKHPLLRPLSGVFASVPLLLVDEIVPSEYRSVWTSRHDNEHSEIFNTADVQSLLRILACTDYRSPWFSPINLLNNKSQKGKRSSHPPTYIQAMALDPLRDDAIVYEKMLSEAGVQTMIDIFPGDTHNALTNLNAIYLPKSDDPNIQDGSLSGMHWLIKLALEAGK